MKTAGYGFVPATVTDQSPRSEKALPVPKFMAINKRVFKYDASVVKTTIISTAKHFFPDFSVEDNRSMVINALEIKLSLALRSYSMQ